MSERNPYTAPVAISAEEYAAKKKLFWACFAALVTTAFGFTIRALIVNQLAIDFGLSETQKGQVMGAGMWPFALSIVLFSLIVDKVGYGRSMIVAFVCHVAFVVVTVCAPVVLKSSGTSAGFWMLYIGSFIGALGNGVVEAVANPMVATMFSDQKTKWLNILHAGWPGGIVLSGILTISLAPTGVIGRTFDHPIGWQWKIGLILVPTIVYGLMMLGKRFPISERVAAGVPYRAMLQQVGIIGALIVVALIVRELGTDFSAPLWLQIAIGAILVLAFGGYAQTLGRPMFIFLLLIMLPLATTELGTDTWITSLMEPVMTKIGWQAGWVLVYTSFIMMILRFCAGSIVHRISPLGLLACGSAVAACGLIALSYSVAGWIFAAATIYGFGKSFFWPTMLGVVAEQYPEGGALTLNVTGAVGMLGVGVVGVVFIGYIQDRNIYSALRTEQPAILARIEGPPKNSVFGTYQSVDQEKSKNLSKPDKELVDTISNQASKSALKTVAILPCIMLLCYLILIGYFRSKGGYDRQVLTGHAAEDKVYTGGVPAPADM